MRLHDKKLVGLDTGTRVFFWRLEILVLLPRKHPSVLVILWAFVSRRCFLWSESHCNLFSYYPSKTFWGLDNICQPQDLLASIISEHTMILSPCFPKIGFPISIIPNQMFDLGSCKFKVFDRNIFKPEDF